MIDFKLNLSQTNKLDSQYVTTSGSGHIINLNRQISDEFNIAENY